MTDGAAESVQASDLQGVAIAQGARLVELRAADLAPAGGVYVDDLLVGVLVCAGVGVAEEEVAR